jgi:hypothetical protein
VPNLLTLVAITVFAQALAGCLLLLSWLQHRRMVALALRGLGFIVAAIATMLIVVARGRIFDFWSIVVGNALLAARLRDSLVRGAKFEGKNVSILLALAGALGWMVLSYWLGNLCSQMQFPGRRLRQSKRLRI